MISMQRPKLTQLDEYFKNYIKHVEEDNLFNALINQQEEFTKFLKFIPVAKEAYAYAEGKWTVKQVIQHLIDTERVFAYRALFISRQPEVEHPGYDENIFADVANAHHRSMQDLIHEFDTVRKSTVELYKSFTKEQVNTLGKASGKAVSPLLLGFTIVGHYHHHVNIFKERYGL